MSEYEWFRKNKAWQYEFKKMKEFGAKAENPGIKLKRNQLYSETYLLRRSRTRIGLIRP